MNESPPVLSLDQVSRQLSGRTIVKGLDIRIRRGEVLGLLGVNGAGKSTTLRMMSGLLAPTTGIIRLGELDLYAHPELGQKQIGYLAEDPPLYAELSVEEYLRFCARLHGIKPQAVCAAVERAIERCELGDMRRRLTSLLSKGFRQRVGLAQAIVHEPDLIVLDEPASGLDPIQALRLRELIHNLADTHAVVLSTHVLSDVLACCDRVAILHHGRLRHSANLSEMDAGAAVLVRVERSLSRDDWMKMDVVAHAEPDDAGRWRIALKEGAQAGDLAKAIGERGFGLQELRGDNNVLEQVFVRIAGETKHAEEAA
ncbi:ABC transporter ATP-binding protein [Dokdonella sp.]|uniref:ABC transporter ATP-binding protein n=1 Tax=Dokdonella sp. TaxID=2291710 RepID=UPI003C694EB5